MFFFLFKSNREKRLDAALKLADAVQSGGHAKVIIQDGEVKVNGEVCTMRGKKLYDGYVVSFNGEDFTNIVNYFLGNGRIADPYMCLADFESYVKTAQNVVDDYANREEWTKRSLLNIAAAGHFAADRSIEEYNEKIWKLTQL